MGTAQGCELRRLRRRCLTSAPWSTNLALIAALCAVSQPVWGHPAFCTTAVSGGGSTTTTIDPSCSTAGVAGSSTCQSVVAAAAQACCTAPNTACTLLFAPGVYIWNTTSGQVSFANTTAVHVGVDTTPMPTAAADLSGGPTEVEFRTFGTRLHGLFTFANVDGVTITGPIVVDAVRQPYTFGRVTAVSPTKVTLSFNATEYPFYPPGSAAALAAPWLQHATNMYGAIDPKLRVPRLPNYWGGGGTLAVDLAASTLTVATSKLSSDFIGEWMVVEHARDASPAFEFHQCSDVAVAGVALYSHAGMGFVATLVNGISLRNVSVTTRTNQRPMSILVDGAHFRKCSGDLHIVDCVFERNGDDGFASHSEYSTVVELIDPATVVVAGEGVDLAAIGEEWIFRDRATLQPLGVRTLVGIDHAGKRMRFNETLPLALKVNDALTATTAPRALIERTRYWGNLGHGIRIKTPNVVVRDCVLGYNSYGAILMIPDAARWMSSLVVANVTIENCTITNGDPWATAQYDVDPASIVVTAYVPETVGPAAGAVSGAVPVGQGMVNSNIVIRNNTIVQALGVCTALLIRATVNFTVANNIVQWPTGTAAGCNVVHALNSAGAVTANECRLANGTVYDCVPDSTLQ